MQFKFLQNNRKKEYFTFVYTVQFSNQRKTFFFLHALKRCYHWVYCHQQQSSHKLAKLNCSLPVVIQAGCHRAQLSSLFCVYCNTDQNLT